MEQKTKIAAEEGKQELVITRDFDLPVDLLFRAFVEPEIIEQWMGTKVLKFEGKKHGSYQFETTDPKGNKYGFNGAIHAFVPNQKIIRTFEMENTPFGVQLEVYEFEPLTEDTSKLTTHIVFESLAHRTQMLQLPFKQGINMAHSRLEEIARKLK
jgi:uncharacterized protein YndB with AHSA1/START domain